MFTQYSCRYGFLLAVVVLWSAGGCGESTRSPAGRLTRASGQFASRRIPDMAVDRVRPQAARVFQQHFRIDPALSTGDMLVSRPMETTERVGTGRVRDVLGSPNRHRLMATLWISQAGSDVVLQCQVRVERLDTAERAAFALARWVMIARRTHRSTGTGPHRPACARSGYRPAGSARPKRISSINSWIDSWAPSRHPEFLPQQRRPHDDAG